jgi:hypothetical protein
MKKNLKSMILIAVFSIFSLSQELSAANINFCGIEIKKRAAGTEFIPAYVDDLNATQKITQDKANAIVELIKTHLSQIGPVVEASRKLIFQPKKVKGKLFGEMDNKNKQPDVAHIRSLSEYITQLKAIPEAEIKAYTENTRRIALKSKKKGAYKKKGSGKNSPVVLDRAKFSDAEEHELADLETRTSSFLNMGQHGVAERQRNIEIATQFLTELRPLIH